MVGYGRADIFFGLITPHGLLELTASSSAPGVGLRIGWAWIAPGPLLQPGAAAGRGRPAGHGRRAGLVGRPSPWRRCWRRS